MQIRATVCVPAVVDPMQPTVHALAAFFRAETRGHYDHVRSMARKLRFDKLLFLATLLLVCAGVVMVYSASAVMALERYQQPDFFLIKQAMWAVLGVALLVIVMRLDYHSYRTPAFLWGSMAVVGTALVLVLFMPAINGSSRWFGIGGIGVQPSELAKLARYFHWRCSSVDASDR